MDKVISYINHNFFWGSSRKGGSMGGGEYPPFLWPWCLNVIDSGVINHRERHCVVVVDCIYHCLFDLKAMLKINKEFLLLDIISTTCAICMEEICANETVQTLPAECKHTFHKVCIQRWLTKVSHTSDTLHTAAAAIIKNIYLYYFIIIMF